MLKLTRWVPLLAFAFFLGAPLIAIAETNRNDKRPNIIVILADDQGWGDISLHGNPNIETPNIDRMARDGAHFENFYVCAVCSPTRAEFLTGRYHARMGVYSTSAGGERFDATERTIGEVFQQAGYQTACYGKWHSGMQYPYHPNARGFDDYYGFCSGHWGNYFDPMLERNGAITRGKGFIVDDLFGQASKFMDAHKDEPVFIYLALNTPHSPMQVPDANWDRFKNKEITPDPAPANAKKQNLEHTRAALAMVENIDENIGILNRYLADNGLLDDTLVLFFSDNGPNGSRFNGGMRGRKGSTFEGGLRSPCIVRYPRQIQPGTKVKRVAGAIDLLPTLAEFAEIDWKAAAIDGKPHDGLSLHADLVTPSDDYLKNDRILFSSWKNKFSARTQQYRMHHTGQLFDIQTDRGENKDVAKERPEVAARLSTAMQQWRETWKAPDPNKTRPFPLGHPDARFTQLPARDATTTGDLKRSNRFPNCTYFLNWTNTDEEIVWDVEVLSAAKHDVELFYACPPDDLGSTIELSLGDQKLTAQLTKAVDGPMIGSPNDRVTRMEGDVREWGSMKLGTIRLEPGRKQLRLRATEIPGSQVGEFRLLLFRNTAL
ncbi:MAG: arylsulfatase [Planctomycetota bacterium]